MFPDLLQHLRDALLNETVQNRRYTKPSRRRLAARLKAVVGQEDGD